MTTTPEPSENLGKHWRTTATHSPGEMMSVYAEIFFAGLPAATVNPDTGGPVFMPERLVRLMFERFGPLKDFGFDERRGVGRATFESGDDAESCYLGMNYSYLPLSSMLPRADAEALDPAGQQYALLYLEFAEYLPFVNPWLVAGDVGVQGASMSRQMLRTCPRRRRFSNLNGSRESTLANFMEGVDVEAIVQEATAVTEGDAAKATDAGDATAAFRALSRRFFTHTLPESVELGKPTSARADPPYKAATASLRVSGLDLWVAYFRTLVDPPAGSLEARALGAAVPAASTAAKASATRRQALALYQQMRRAVDEGAVHLIDPIELARHDPLVLGRTDALCRAQSTILSTVRSKDKTGVPMNRRVQVRALFALSSRAGSSKADAEAVAGLGAPARDSLEETGAALQWTAAFLSFKVCAADEPGRDVALSVFLDPAMQQKLRRDAEVEATRAGEAAPEATSAAALLPIRRAWAGDLLAAHLRMASAGADEMAGGEARAAERATLFSGEPKGTCLAVAALNALYRGGALSSAVGAAKLIDQQASSGSLDALWGIARPVTAEEIHADAQERNKPFRGLRLFLSVAWLIVRVPFMLLLVAAFLFVGITSMLGGGNGAPVSGRRL
jgi:hypothetical protein